MKSIIFGLCLFLSSVVYGFDGQPYSAKLFSDEGEVYSIFLDYIDLNELYITSCDVNYETGFSVAKFQADLDNSFDMDFEGVKLSLTTVKSEFMGFACDFRIKGSHIFTFKNDELVIKLKMYVNQHPYFKVEKFDAVLKNKKLSGQTIENH